MPSERQCVRGGVKLPARSTVLFVCAHGARSHLHSVPDGLKVAAGEKVEIIARVAEARARVEEEAVGDVKAWALNRSKGNEGERHQGGAPQSTQKPFPLFLHEPRDTPSLSSGASE